MYTKERSLVLFCVLILLELPALPLCRAAGTGVQLEVSADASTVHAWESCNVTARLTENGTPLANVDVSWQASAGVMEANISTTDGEGMTTMQFTATVSAIHGTPVKADIGARATVNGAEYSATTNITIDPAPVDWTGQVSYQASAGELAPGDYLSVYVNIEQPNNTKCNYIANFTVEADIYDTSLNLVNTVVLGKNLSLTPGMKWSSWKSLFQTPMNPTILNYQWTFYIMSPHGTWIYYQPENMIPVKVLTAPMDKLTFLLYLDGDNNMADWTRSYFNSLEEHAPTHFTVLVQWDLPNQATTRWKLTYDDNYSVVNSQLLGTLPNVDSGDWKNLLAFMDWGADLAPAYEYILSLCDHGGSFCGTCWDDSSHTVLEPTGISQALANFSVAHRKVSILVFESCLMASMEMVHQLTDVTDIMIGFEPCTFNEIISKYTLRDLDGYVFHTSGALIDNEELDCIIGDYQNYYGYNAPLTVTNIMAWQHTIIADLDSLGKALVNDSAAVKKFVMEARDDGLPVWGPLTGLDYLVDAKTFFTYLESLFKNSGQPFADQISAIDMFLKDYNHMNYYSGQPSPYPYNTITGFSLFLPPSSACYISMRDHYIKEGLPESNGWIQFLDSIFMPIKYTQSGTQTVFPAYPDYSSYPVASAGVSVCDTNNDGMAESLAADIQCDQKGNSGPVTVILDLITSNGTHGGLLQGLADRKVFTVGAGTETVENIRLSSPVQDVEDAVLTVLTDRGAPLEQLHIGRFWMSADNRTGQPPQLNISASVLSPTEGQAVNFTATTTGAPSGNLTIWWDFDEHDGVGLDATGASASCRYRGGWNRTVTCIASDGTNLAVQTLEIDVVSDMADRQPVANLTAIFLDPAHPLKVTLNASRTNDPDGEQVEYLFDFGDQNITTWASGPVVEHEYATPGNYDCAVMVRDHTPYNGSIATITVQPGTTSVTLPPVAALKLSATKVRAGKAVTADATGSSDPAGSPLLFQIAWGDGNVTDWSNSTNATHIYERAGNYTIELTVRNKWDIAAAAISTVTVVPKPKASKAAFIPGSTSAIAVVAIAMAVGLTMARKRK